MSDDTETDRTVADIHRTRRDISERFGDDVDAIHEDARRRFEEFGRPVWRKSCDGAGNGETGPDPSGGSVRGVAAVWHSRDPGVWRRALARYREFVKPDNLPLEQSLERLSLERIRTLDAEGWYAFLRDEYFRWKYTAPNRYATTTRSLERYRGEPGGLERLHEIKIRLLDLDPADVRGGLRTAAEIKGLGTAGASGLLSLLYPDSFATVDQFVVKALRDVGDVDAAALATMKPEALSATDGVRLIGIMAAKAAENARLFEWTGWTPRAVDKILWTFGR